MSLNQSRFIFAALVRLFHHVSSIEQVAYLIEINFLEGNSHRLNIGVYGFENLVNSSGDDSSLALIFAAETVGAHGVSFATACLSVGEDADVMTIEEARN